MLFVVSFPATVIGLITVFYLQISISIDLELRLKNIHPAETALSSDWSVESLSGCLLEFTLIQSECSVKSATKYFFTDNHHIPKATVQIRLQENNRNSTTCSHF